MFGLPVHSTRHQSPHARPSGTRTAGFVGAAMLLAVIGSAQEKAAAPASPPAENKPAEFVGSTTCQMCHEDIFNAFQKNPHQLVETDKKRGWDTKACESCHGPGSKHAESASAADIRQPAKLTPGEGDRICLTCHRNQSTHSGLINSCHALLSTPKRPIEHNPGPQTGQLPRLPLDPQDRTPRPRGPRARRDHLPLRR